MSAAPVKIVSHVETPGPLLVSSRKPVETHMLNFWYHRRNSSENKTPQSRGDRLIVASSLNV
jgi:hypothetical protein